MGLAIFLTLATSFIKDDLVGPILKQRGAGNRPNLFHRCPAGPERGLANPAPSAFPDASPLVAPLVRARLKAINGRPVRGARGGGRQRGANPPRGLPHPESRTSPTARCWRKAKPSSPGASGAIPGRPSRKISLEEFFAQSIQARLGDELAFDVQGQEIRGKVTSLRKVVWQTMRPNFFIVLHPSLLSGAPRLDLVALEAESGETPAPASRRRWRRPSLNITVIDISGSGPQGGPDPGPDLDRGPRPSPRSCWPPASWCWPRACWRAAWAGSGIWPCCAPLGATHGTLLGSLL
ncbi:MAG: hypothetical protein IPQ13_00020 [Holophagaceae bacterium]|nr:hypothetical protein [Holophagaceae bacterium]